MAKEKKHPELSKLKGRIREKRTTYEELSEYLGMGENTLSNKINGFSDFYTNEIIRIAEFLEIPKTEIVEYFFPEMLHNAQ